MNNTIKIILTAAEELQQILIAELSAIGFDAFEEKENELQAFIREESFEENALQNILSGYNLGFQKEVVKEENWNALWESNFQPVIVDDFCVIRADFHAPIPGSQHEIVITPKMSFGTGHHATTYMMVSQMSQLDFKNKIVADFGTGTGILAILAEKLGAKNTWAIDNDDWSMENAAENIEKNNCQNIRLEKVNSFATAEQFDIILANINRNVILENADHLQKALKNGSTLLLSGLLESDEGDIVNIFQQHNICKIKTLHRNNWISILMEYKGNL